MAEFIHFEATDENENDVEMSESNDKNSSMESFINDDSSIENTEIEQYFHNLQVDMKEANERIQKEALERIQDFDDYSNLSYVSDEDELSSVHDFSKSTDQIEKFKKNLLPIGQNESKYDFVKIISYKVRQILEGKTDECLDESLKENPIIESLFEDLNEKFIFSLDIQKFELVCYEINQILIKHDFFLRVVEQKNKYRNILIKTPEKQNQIKELASCLSQKYNGFQVVKNAFSKLQRRDFQPIDIIYIPTKNIQILPVCYYTVDISNAYTALYSEGEKIRRALTLYECYYCNKFFRQKGKAEIHLKVCSGKPGIVYNFCSQTLTSFEDNFKSKGDVPFTIYFDFETTSPTDADWLNPEDKKMFVVSYIIVVAFHPYFNYEKILVQRSVSHPKKELISINYLSREQFAFKTPEIIKQLYDQAILVSKRTCKNALGVMFGIELSFIKRTLLNWFNKKVSAPYKKLDQTQITKYEQENPISWGKKPKCVICKMSLNSVFSSVKKPDSEMYYADYIVRYEYKFLKNTLTKEQLESSKDLKTLESYYTAFGPLSYKVTAKAHSTMLPKKYIPLYLEDLAFIIKRYGWVVTKIHAHLTFDQAPFKKDFILMNQKSRQLSKTNTEKDFYKLMNNANFGSDCRNNIENCDFVPIFDEINEIYSLQKYYSLLDPKINNFVSGKLIEDHVNNKFTERFHALDKNDRFYEIKLATLKNEQQEGLEAAKKLTNKRKNLKRKVTITDYYDRMNEVNQKKNVASLIEFDQQNSNSIKAVMVKKIKALNQLLDSLAEKC